MAPGEIGSFTISPMFCCSVLFVCGPSKYVCVRATFDRFRRAQKRFYNSCVHISWRFIPEALPRVRLWKRLFFLFALAHFLACFFFVSLPTHTHTLAPFYFEMHAHSARKRGPKRKPENNDAGVCCWRTRSHLIAAFIIIIFCPARVVRERSKDSHSANNNLE